MLIELIEQFNAITQRNNVSFFSMQDNLGMVQKIGEKKLNLQAIHKLHNKNNRLAFAEIKNDFIVKAMNNWYGSLAEETK